MFEFSKKDREIASASDIGSGIDLSCKFKIKHTIETEALYNIVLNFCNPDTFRLPSRYQRRSFLPIFRSCFYFIRIKYFQ